MTENLYLAHHGVKGMKWGVRRTPEQLGHPSRRVNKATYKADKADAKDAYRSAKAKNNAAYQRALGRSQQAFDKEFTDKERKVLEERAKREKAVKKAKLNEQYGDGDEWDTMVEQWYADMHRASNKTTYAKADYQKALQEERDNKAAAKRSAANAKARAAYKQAKTMAKVDYRLRSKSGKARFYDSEAVKTELARRVRDL